MRRVVLLARFHKIEINLAAAQNGRGGFLSSGTNWMVVAPGTHSAWSRKTRWNEVPGSRSLRKETQRLWRSSDFGVIRIKGFLKIAHQLAPQHMEIIGRVVGITDLQIVLRTKLQITLQRAEECSGPWPS